MEPSTTVAPRHDDRTLRVLASSPFVSQLLHKKDPWISHWNVEPPSEIIGKRSELTVSIEIRGHMCIHRNIEITVNFELGHHYIYAQNNICIAMAISFSLQVTECACSKLFLGNDEGMSRILIAVFCLPFKEDSQRGKWVCHEYS